MTPEKCVARHDVGSRPRRAVLSFVVLALGLGACHTSCTEATGAEPVVTIEAGAVLGAPHAVATHPVRIRPVVPLHLNGAPPPADSE